MKVAKNPILRGFNPDPSIIRVGDDYYIATSTFEWFPGVQIHHSRDLKNWQLITRPLNRVSQLDMLGNPDSCGVWAPCLSYDDGIFYLVYSNVRSFDGPFKDTPNYLVWTDDIRGDWSEPVFLGASGFDGSLFHDEDGKKWFSSMLVDHRGGRFFGGIVLQEYDHEQRKTVGPIHRIFGNTELDCTEAPHIYKRNGYYYLILAEGGTEYGHAVTLLRSKEITGPYELHPENPIISSRWDPDAPLQKAGHADWVETREGETYIVFLVGRPLSKQGRCITGRETAIEELVWKEDDWPYLKAGGRVPRLEVELPDLPEHAFPKDPKRDEFEGDQLNIHWQALRIPITNDWASLTDRKGYLRLYGRESLVSFHRQSLLARRVQAHHIVASTCVEFDPDHFQQMAGLVCYYNTYHWHYLYVAGNDQGGKVLAILTCDKYAANEPIEPVDISHLPEVYLKVDFNGASLQFLYGADEKNYLPIGPVLDGSILSDDYVQDAENRYRAAFTGAFVGLCCQDLSGVHKHADFKWFEYIEFD